MSGRLVRRVALLTLVAQIAFVMSWLIAGLWQGAGYSALAHSISDMYAVTAPGGMFLVVVITLCLCRRSCALLGTRAYASAISRRSRSTVAACL